MIFCIRAENRACRIVIQYGINKAFPYAAHHMAAIMLYQRNFPVIQKTAD